MYEWKQEERKKAYKIKKKKRKKERRKGRKIKVQLMNEQKEILRRTLMDEEWNWISIKA